ncbi:bifunctional GTP diphosphokinase/guanosine-3',5'-bis pyrophosphate 3'-pyrophosphohydrolase [Agitococcus lubricus]|uniref:guanosine-3',5'-bis(diphosphate) 3'-diphosphatase n=1 Tax=Agitococcus lubricus TaxID=1077255 RepID=A0A2T5J331_9GAMM|nr:bifunctional GTP diphosphokinase/guanosine-3',5'-bis pyrophosphate 3'-pyrophosphohydrolase [Agitococcus lubricus]PTQ91027.1 RelA/SpoT family (p)ppGpp synthetase [Agitococcus lubricus]
MSAGLDVLCQHLSSYLAPEQIAEVRAAYQFADQAHQGQSRRDGTPYITHPLAVADILSKMHMDHQSLMAAMLHDVIEDTGISKDELSKLFGQEVAELVDGVTKLEKVGHISKAEAQAENLRKMMLAMTQDIRVIIVKLADRLHNMRTLHVLKPEKRRRIAQETLDIYAPLANRLGMNTVRVELEDLCFYALFPMRAPLIQKAVKVAHGNRKELVYTIQEAIKKRLAEEGINARVIGREKHLYSIYQKMKEKHKSFNEIMDVYGFRIIVDSVDTCYRTLGATHNLYKPIPGKFKDYIAIPKANGYQSLHSVLKGQRGVPIEIQIRTEAMEAMANNGIAAHWLYKDGFTNTSQARAREWMSSLLELQKTAGNSLDFIENVKIDLFPDEVYVFTPKGRILTLPKGATPVDFAYAVHSDIGNSCIAAKVDSRLAPLSLILETGQTVEIVTAPGVSPNPHWLNFVITSKARTNIRNFLKDQQITQSVELGQRLLDRALSAYGTRLNQVNRHLIQQVLTELNFANLDALLEDIGLGNRAPQLVARRLLPEDTKEQARPQTRHLAISGTEGLVVSYARCCRPLPGDSIIGHLSAGRGIVIHRDVCNNLVSELRDNPDKCMPLQWSKDISREFQSELRIELANQRGMLAEIAREVTISEANIEGIHMQEKGSHHAVLSMSLTVKNRIHLAQIIKRIRILTGVEKVTRVRA